MRIAVLTTETAHHAHFVRSIYAHGRTVVAFVEKPVLARYDTWHPFEDERNAYECQTWFNGVLPRIKDFAAAEDLTDLSLAADQVRAFSPNLVIAFGTRILRGEMLCLHPDTFNLHGGDPHTYRGSDTHLWAIWHRQFDELKTCIHRLTQVVDGGEIVTVEPIPLFKNMRLHQLRAVNTEVCIKLVERVIADLTASGSIKTLGEKGNGRLYFQMPAVLKDDCVRRFERYTGTLSDGLRGTAES